MLDIACLNNQNITRNKLLLVNADHLAHHQGLPGAIYESITYKYFHLFLILALIF